MDNPYGPWEKFAGDPIFAKTDAGINGTRHGDFFYNKNDERWYVLS
ncbi:MAG TPA: hypothetical protein VK957_12345 [Lunatimonas sp.]|nr:hypothetical protein [Lunatimonas sp.]